MRPIITTTTRLALIPALACAAGLAPAADGTQRSDQDKLTLKGTVEAFSTASINQRGQQSERGLARIRLENGRSAIVDLGDRRDLRKVDIEQGDFVKIGGTKSSLNGQTILVADRLRVREQDPRQQQRARQQGHGNRQQQSDRDRQQRQGNRRQQGQRGSEALVKLKGEIASTRRDGQTTLLTMRMEDGTQRTVVIPSRFDISDVELTDADRIQLMGRNARNRQGDRAVVAERLRIDGQEIQRRDRQQQSGTQQWERQQAQRGQHAQRQQQRGQQRQQAQQQRQQRGQQSQQQQRGQSTISGTIESFAKVRIKNAPEDNLFARVRMEDGSSRIVDFGEISRARLLKLDSGDEVQIKGMKRTLGEHQVLEARSVKVRNAGDQQKPQRNRNMVRSGIDVRGDNVMLQGTVEGIKKVKIQGQNEELTVMKLKLKDGSSQIVNLSPWLAKQFLGIEQGDEVVASGVTRQTQQGKEVLIVDGILVVDDRQARADAQQQDSTR